MGDYEGEYTIASKYGNINIYASGVDEAKNRVVLLLREIYKFHGTIRSVGWNHHEWRGYIWGCV